MEKMEEGGVKKEVMTMEDLMEKWYEEKEGEELMRKKCEKELVVDKVVEKKGMF